jgi:hypothetical protein
MSPVAAEYDQPWVHWALAAVLNHRLDPKQPRSWFRAQPFGVGQTVRRCLPDSTRVPRPRSSSPANGIRPRSLTVRRARLGGGRGVLLYVR